jgi:hypothetical protein
MGLEAGTIRFLLETRKNGLNLERVLTIGRQGMHITAPGLSKLLEEYGLPCGIEQARRLIEAEKGFAEPFLRHIGAGHIDSMDIAPYEGATLLHDMNRAVPTEWHGRYSLVLDGGSLEHVFHYPQALKNCLEMVAENGRFVSITPANNLLGHGFYQISPELFFRVLDKRNGYLCEKVLVFEEPFQDEWYEVSDPAQVRERVELVNTRPTYLIAMGCRERVQDVFSTTPQQSDYSTLWSDNEDTQIDVSATRAKPPVWWKRLMPQKLVRAFRLWRPYRERFYRRRTW